METITRRESLLLLAAGVTMTGCGGGGGGGTPSPPPPPPLPPPPPPLPPPPATLFHIPVHGQSNANGEQAKPPLTIAPTGWGNVSFRRGVKTWREGDNAAIPEARPASDFEFVDLFADLLPDIVETRANGLADALKSQLVGGTAPVATGDRVLVSIISRGGAKLTELGPDNDGGLGLWPTLLDDLRRGRDRATALGMACRIPFWNMDQGEAEVDYRPFRSSAPLAPSAFVADYATRFIATARAFDTQARALTGFSAPCIATPPATQLHVNTALLDAARADPLVIVAGPRYQLPNAQQSDPRGEWIHQSPDGQRWAGEMVAKVGRRVMAGELWKPLHALSARLSAPGVVEVRLHVPRGTITIDTDSWPAIYGGGFRIFAGSIDNRLVNEPPLTIEVAGADLLRLTFASIPAGAMLSMGANGYYAGMLGKIVTNVERSGGMQALDFADDFLVAAQGAARDNPFFGYGPRGAATIRSAERRGAGTRLIGEVAEATGDFLPGDRVDFSRAVNCSNIRDSDDAVSLSRFARGPRAGQSYPLWNWLMPYDGLRIDGA